MNAAIQHSYPDWLGDAFHDLPAEEAGVGLALLLPPDDHVPPIGLFVGAGIQESLEVQAVLLPKAHYMSMPPAMVSPKTQAGPALPTPNFPPGRCKDQ